MRGWGWVGGWLGVCVGGGITVSYWGIQTSQGQLQGISQEALGEKGLGGVITVSSWGMKTQSKVCVPYEYRACA